MRLVWVAFSMLFGCGARSDLAPVPAKVARPVQLALGNADSCVLRADGRVQCWGYADLDRLGVPTEQLSCSRATACRVTVPNVEGAVQISVPADGFALLRDGSLLGWGTNNFGELGPTTRMCIDQNCTGGERWAPPRIVETFKMPLVAVSAAGGYTCGLDSEGHIWCTGRVPGGVAGDNPNAPSEHFGAVPIAGLPGVAAIAAGDHHMCALDAAGGVWCWGSRVELGEDCNHQLGPSHDPLQVPAPVSFVQIVAGGYQSCAVDKDGGGWCWGGCDETGVIGDGTTLPRPTPVRISGIGPVAKIAAGAYHTCALLRDGTVACWGGNNLGQIGVQPSPNPLGGPPEVDSNPLPIVVRGLAEVVDLSAGFTHACAITARGEVWCWGDNEYGQLGVGASATEYKRWNRSFSSVPIRAVAR